MKNKVQIVAPASYAELTSSQKKYILSFLSQKGLPAGWARHAFSKGMIWGAFDKDRLSDLMKAFRENVPIVLALRGGYGSSRLLPLIDWSVLEKSKSIFVGFSDLTSFQNACYAKTGKPSITGLLAGFIRQKPDELLWMSFEKVLKGEGIDFKGLPHLVSGKASGTLIGGNLTCFESLIGTPYLPNLRGKILLLEEVAEAPYKLDRMLTHLKNAGVFDKVSGVLLGDFYKCRNNDDTTDDNAYRVLKDFFKGFKIPVVYGVPYGHTPQHVCLPFGTKVSIDTKKQIVHIDGLGKKCYTAGNLKK